MMLTTDPPYILREMQEEDLPAAMRLKEAEGWNQTLDDWKFFLNGPGNISLVAGEEDRVTGTAVAVGYAEHLFWLGMVLVDRHHRGKGIAKSLLNALIARVSPKGYIKLDATPEGRKVYEKMGFHGEYEIYRMVNPSVENISPEQEEAGLVRACHEHAAWIIRYDRQVFGAGRPALIRRLLQEDTAHARILLRDNEPEGFLLGRQGSRYFHAGPLSAKSPDSAKSLLKNTLVSLTGQAVTVDVTAYQQELIDWLEKNNFRKQRPFLRMYLNDNLTTGERRCQYLIAGPEYG
jgi:GNAT superfamily N-acetyltransferase